MKTYVILNAALNTDDWLDWLIQFYCKAASYYGNSKYKSARIINICHSPSIEQLSLDDITAIQNADKIIIAGHCYMDDHLRDRLHTNNVWPDYLAELLGYALNRAPEKLRQISIVACESENFGNDLSIACGFYPTLALIPITARKFDVWINLKTGRKFNNVRDIENEGFHHTAFNVTYKVRFFYEPGTGDRCKEDIRGSLRPQN